MEHEDFLEPNLSIGEARQLIRSLKQLRNTPIPASILARIRAQLSLNMADGAQHMSNGMPPSLQGLGDVLPVRQLKQCVDDETQPSVEIHKPAQEKTANRRKVLPAGSKMDDGN